MILNIHGIKSAYNNDVMINGRNLRAFPAFRPQAEERAWEPTVYTFPDFSSLNLMLEEPVIIQIKRFMQQPQACQKYSPRKILNHRRKQIKEYMSTHTCICSFSSSALYDNILLMHYACIYIPSAIAHINGTLNFSILQFG